MCRLDRVTSLLFNEAQLSELNHQHACAIVAGGKVIASGHNSKRTYFKGELQRAFLALASRSP